MSTADRHIATFICCIPDVAAALKVSGQGDGRLQFDIPSSELPEVLRLIAFGRDCALRVTVESVSATA